MSRRGSTAVAGTLAFALLVGGCVFTALAGPAFSLHSRTQALRQTLGRLASSGKTVQMTAGWSDFTNPNGVPPELAAAGPDAGQPRGVGERAWRRPSRAAAPAGARRVGGRGHEAAPVQPGSAAPGGAPGEVPVSLEVAYRDPLARPTRRWWPVSTGTRCRPGRWESRPPRRRRRCSGCIRAAAWR